MFAPCVDWNLFSLPLAVTIVDVLSMDVCRLEEYEELLDNSEQTNEQILRGSHSQLRDTIVSAHCFVLCVCHCTLCMCIYVACIKMY